MKKIKVDLSRAQKLPLLDSRVLEDVTKRLMDAVSETQDNLEIVVKIREAYHDNLSASALIAMGVPLIISCFSMLYLTWRYDTVRPFNLFTFLFALWAACSFTVHYLFQKIKGY